MRIRDIEFVTGAVDWEGMPWDGRPEVAFVGRSNVGKSSLINMLARQDGVARTSGTPGKTREFNYYLVNNSFYFVDLPGYGYAKTSKKDRQRWGEFIGQYLNERPPLRLVFHLIDSRHPPTSLDEDVLDLMRGSSVPYVIALTKTDKLSGNERPKSVARVKKILQQVHREVPIELTSAKDERGRSELLRWMDALVGV